MPSASVVSTKRFPDIRRTLIVGILIITLTTCALVVVALARGGRPDPPELRGAATLLDGPWHFRTGDDLAWARTDLDDSVWETIDLTAAPGSHDGDVGLPDYVGGWMAHGHPEYHGYAWYRRSVDVPAEPRSWDVLGPTLVDGGYELYWNGRKLGGSGLLGPRPRLVGTRPMRFALPPDAAGTVGVLAVRAYLPPGAGAPVDGGGMHTAPILAPAPTAAALHRVQWERTIAGYVVDAIEPLGMLALIGLAFAQRSRSTHRDFLVFACVALALMAERRLNNAIVAWTDLQDLATYAWLASVMWVPTVAAWLMAWNRWSGPAWRTIDVLAILLAVAGFVGALLPSASLTRVCRVAAIAMFFAMAVRIMRAGPHRLLALCTLAALVAGLFGGELLDPLGVPGIWFPFNIGVSRTQYIYALVIPLLAFVVARTVSDFPAQRRAPGG